VGEVKWIVRNEYVVHLSDLVCRRSLIALLGDACEPVLRELADIAGAVLGWDEKRKDWEVRETLSQG
jgi:glycerol-3-phosphate dehydrogenase